MPNCPGQKLVGAPVSNFNLYPDMRSTNEMGERTDLRKASMNFASINQIKSLNETNDHEIINGWLAKAGKTVVTATHLSSSFSSNSEEI